MNKRILLISFSLLSAISAIAQGGGPSNPPGPPGGGDVDDVNVPIDNHLWILVILAVVLGVLFVKLQSLRSKV